MRESYFSAAFFMANRQRLNKLFIGKAPIVITANGVLQRNSDNEFSFRQDSNFWYLTGVDEPDIVLVIDKDREYLILPERTTVQDIFDGAINAESLKTSSGINEVLDYKTGWKRLAARLSRVKHVATLAPPFGFINHQSLYTNPARAHLVKHMQEINPKLELLALRPQLVRMRSIKQEPELHAIQKAIDITVASFKELSKKGFAKFSSENEVEALFTGNFRRQNSKHAFNPVVSGGPRSCSLHYVKNNQVLKTNELITIDIGAEVENYSADITRTYALTTPTKRQQAIIEAVAAVQEYAFGLLKPGVLMRDYEQQVGQFMGEKLRELNLIKSIKHDAVRQFFPHATSHFLGLDTHDVGDYEQPLEPNMVMAVEPGIYIPDEGIGVRIEDNVIITKNGAKVLSKQLPANNFSK